MLTKLFSGDPNTALSKARQKLADVENNIAALQAQRTAKLVIAETPEEVLAIDRSIAAERANAEIYRDRIRALQEECRKGVFAEREQQRSKSITKIKERLKRREVLAAKLQSLIEQVGVTYSELVAPDEIESEWCFSRPDSGFALIDRRGVDREVGWSLHGLVAENGVPEPSSRGLGVVGTRAAGLPL